MADPLTPEPLEAWRASLNPNEQQFIAELHSDEGQHYWSGRANQAWIDGIKARWRAKQNPEDHPHHPVGRTTLISEQQRQEWGDLRRDEPETPTPKSQDASSSTRPGLDEFWDRVKAARSQDDKPEPEDSAGSPQEEYAGRGQYLSGKQRSKWHQKLFRWIANHPKTRVGSGLAMAGTGLGTELSNAPRLAGVFYGISWLIWVTVIYFSGLWKKNRPLSIALMGGLALGLFGFWRVLLPERQPTPEEYAEAVWRKAPSNVVATPTPILIDPAFPDDLKSVAIAMGAYEINCNVSDLENGVPLPWTSPGGTPVPESILREKPLPVFLAVRNGKLYTNVELTNVRCEPEMILKDNQITLNRSDWDRNMNGDALEVVDDAQHPVFQVIYERPARVRVHGAFCSPHGIVFAYRMGFGVSEYGHYVPKGLIKIFRYPSWKHPGETVNKEN